MAAADSKNYYHPGESASMISDPTAKELNKTKTDEKKNAEGQTQQAQLNKSNPKINAANKKRFPLMGAIRRKFQAVKDWAHDRKIHLRVYNDDFIRDIPPLYVTRILMDDEINLDTDEDRGYLTPDVKKITELGGAPLNTEVITCANWDEFVPRARTPIKRPATAPFS